MNYTYTSYKLSRRDDFAKAALQGLLSDGATSGSYERFAKSALKFADALIAELDKTTIGTGVGTIDHHEEKPL